MGVFNIVKNFARKPKFARPPHLVGDRASFKRQSYRLRLARQRAGVVPLQRWNARVKALASA
jgi:hypothetical protein